MHSKADPALPSDSLVPIRTISSLTGVNPVTLRAWERRYQLLRPTRTPKGHRLYSMADVDRIKQVVTLLDSGMTISQVRTIIDGDADADGSAAAAAAGSAGSDLWRGYRDRMLSAVAAFDEATLGMLYSEIQSLYPTDTVTERLIVPLLQELGFRWQRGGASRIAEEHFFSLFLRNKLGARLHHRGMHGNGPKLLAACLPGEQHETGLLLFALAAQDWGYRLILLGADMPLDELPAVAAHTGCDGVVLAGSGIPRPLIDGDALRSAVAQIAAPVFIGGRVTDKHAGQFAGTGVHVLGSRFDTALREINAVLRPNGGDSADPNGGGNAG